MADGGTRNEFGGSAQNVVMAGTIQGGVHLHCTPKPDSPIPRQLPADTSYFTDREPHIASLDAWLSTSHEQDSPHINLIAGVGGVGKTSLAAHWAHRAREHFPDGDLYLNLRGYHPEQAVSAAEALDRLLRALDVPGDRIPVDLDTRAAMYRSLLHGKRMLILLDNAAATDQVRPLLPGNPTCRTLVTSRDQLSGLSVRDGAKRIELRTFKPDQAIELIEKVTGEDRVRDEAARSDELIRYCGNLPLALRIAAEKLASNPGMHIADLVEELAEERERLDALSIEGDDAATLRAVFSWSYRTLPPDRKHVFRLLSLPAGADITAQGAAVLCGISIPRAKRELNALVAAHLLELDPESQRYRFHDLVRVYAAECALEDESPEDRRNALRRLFTWYAHVALAAAQVFSPGFTSIPVDLPEPFTAPPDFPDRRAALRWCDEERENLVTAVRKAAEIGEHTLAWQLPVTMFGYFIARRALDPWLETYDVGLASARLVEAPAAEAWLLTGSATASRDLRRYDTAEEQFRQAIARWNALGERWAEAWALRDLGGVYHHLGRHQDAIDALERALAMHIEENDAWGEATAAGMLAAPYQSVGRHDEALRLLARAMEIRRAQNDQRNIGRTLNEYGSVFNDLGRTDEALAVLEEGLEIHTEIDNWHGQATAHDHLGTTFARLNRPGEAAEHWQSAADLYEQLGDPLAGDLRRRLQDLDDTASGSA